MNIGELISEAEQSLREADPLCVDANAFYTELRLLVEQSTILWARILFLHAAQQDQLQSMGNICLVIKNGIEKAQIECKQRAKSMKRSRNELRSLLSALQQTTVDPAFMGNNHLYDYVHEEDVSVLESEVDKLIEQLNRLVADIERLPGQIELQIGDVRSHSPELPSVIESSIPRKIAKLTTKAAPYASDMADVLTSLTKHYDLCSEIQQLSADEAEEAMKVALSDHEQLPGALDRLRECKAQLKQKHRESQRLQHSMAMSFEYFKDFEDRVTLFIADYLKPALQKVSAKRQECEQLFVQVDAITAELTGLTDYYRFFKKSYHALVVEVVRRHESAKQLRKVVENANNALRSFHTRESEVRQAFIDTYQEFLPKELWPNTLDMPREYAILLEPEELPELSKTSLMEAMKDYDG